MKKYLGTFFIGALLLTGCSEKNDEQTVEKEVVETIKDNTEEKEQLADTDIEEQAVEDPNQKLKLKIQKIIDSDFSFNTSLKNFEVNNNLGTGTANDNIALIYLSYDQPHSEETTKKWIDEYTSHLAASLADETDITSLTIFWETPRFKENWNTAKFQLTKKDGVFYFDTENYDKTVF